MSQKAGGAVGAGKLYENILNKQLAERNLDKILKSSS